MSEQPAAAREPKIPSLADYMMRYDLTAMLQEAKAEYREATAGGPRHLTQKDIAARFRNMRRSTKAQHE